MSEKMNVVAIVDERKAEMREVTRPKPLKGQVLIKIDGCALCTFEQRMFTRVVPVPLPFVGGHEFTGTIVGASIKFDLSVFPGAAYVIGNAAGGSWTDADAAWQMTAPADASGLWTSPAFTASGELRAYIKVPGIDWWRTEFTLNNGALYWRLVDIPNNWAENVGPDFSVNVTPGQKLYVNFDYNTGEVK